MNRGWIIMALGAALAAPGAAVAQGIGLGAKVGVSIAKLDFDDAEDDEEVNNISAFIGGGFLRFSLGRVALQPELLAVTKGAEFDAGGEDGGRIKLDYVEVPVLLVLDLAAGAFRPYIMAGPTFSAEIGCSLEDDESDQEIDCDDDIADAVERKSFDVGGALGGGLSIGLGPGRLFAEARYNIGFTNIDDSDDEVTVKNRATYFLAGFMIQLGR